MTDTVIPCEKNAALEKLILEYVEVLKTNAHLLGAHGLNEQEFYNSGLFRGAIEHVRGQFAATSALKLDFARHIFNHMQDRGFIVDWESATTANRHDYIVTLRTGRVAGVELKGCLDGNNTLIFSRPARAQEFVIWSVCTNPAADPRKNAWSGIHTRLSADIVERGQLVDGVVIWDMACGTVGRPCPKLFERLDRATTLANYKLPPPCIYVFPGAIPSPHNNAQAPAQSLADVQLLQALHECFGGTEDEVNYVDFEVRQDAAETVRKTRVRRRESVVKESKFTPIRRP